jgi:Ferritin-like domain
VRRSPTPNGSAPEAVDQRSRNPSAEAATAPASSTRAGFLIGALGAVAAGGIAGELLHPHVGAAAPGPSRKEDVRILNYLLLLEYLQEGLYAEAQEAGALKGELSRFAQVAGAHERQHVAALRGLLGGNADSKPEFDFGDAAHDQAKFAAAALTLEETAAAAYIGQAANLTDARIIDVARIVAVEARHAAWIRDLVHRLPAPQAADPAATPAQVTNTLDRTGFVKRS